MKYLFIDASENSTFAQTGNATGFRSQVFATDRNFAARITNICDEMLQNADMAFADLDLLAVCTGPGSLTGLRVAAAFLRTAAMLANKPLVGISIFDWSLQTLVEKNISGGVRLVMPTLIDKAFSINADLPDLNHSQPELIERTTAGAMPYTYGIRFSYPGVTSLQPEPTALHKLINLGCHSPARSLPEILNVLPLYVIPSQAERKFKEAS
ncbi:MAG TPA: hypothetical protein PLK28_03515 [Candidatus Rifleibacterium sp.]|nr:hypothetical protein [Candidatus Rifleibacterium sp.]